MTKTAIYSNPPRRAAGLAYCAMTRWPLLLFLCLAAAGCAVGQSGYSCSGIPAGVQCRNAREVLEASKGIDGPVTPTTMEQSKNDNNRHQAVPVSGIVPEETFGAVPLRTPSRVMRIWYAPWENESGDLHVAKILYTEIEPRRWTIGQPVSAPPTNITPLEPAWTSPPAPGSAASRPTPSTTPSDEPSGTNVPRGTIPAALGGLSINRNQNHGDFNEIFKP